MDERAEEFYLMWRDDFIKARRRWEAQWQKRKAFLLSSTPTVRQDALLDRITSIQPKEEEGVYPFKGYGLLTREDVEWLLVACEKRSLVLDLRGADLRLADLHGLRLKNARVGLSFDDAHEDIDLMQMASVNLEEANLCETDLENLCLIQANLKRARLARANLKGVEFDWADLQGAVLSKANLEEASFIGARMQRASFREAYLKSANFQGAHLEETTFSSAIFDDTDFGEANLQRASFGLGQPGEPRSLRHLRGIDLWQAHLEKAHLNSADLRGVNLGGTHLEGAKLSESRLEGADLRGAYVDNTTDLRDVTFSDGKLQAALLADISWGNVNLTVVDWTQLRVVGEEFRALQMNDISGRPKKRNEQITNYQAAVRATRQISVALQSQGMIEEASNFAYRTKILQRRLHLLHVLQDIERTPRLYWLVPRKVRESAQISMPFTTRDKFTMLLCFMIGLIFAILAIPELYQRPVSLEALFVILVALVLLGMVFVYSISVKYQLRLLLFSLAMAIGYVLALAGIFFAAGYLLTHPNVLIIILTIPAAALMLYLVLSIVITPVFDQKEIFKWIVAQKELVRKLGGGVLTAIRPPIRIQMAYGRYCFSWFLDLLAGYGYKPVRSLIAYLLVIIGFASLYNVFGHFSPLEALIFSVTSFHGRGFFPGNLISLVDPRVILAAIEAIVGLIIEISFIATFTQRYFGK